MIELKNFTNLNSDEILATFIARSNPQIASFLTRAAPNYEAHKNFINYLKNQDDKRYFMLKKGKDFIGVIYFINIKNNSAEFGLFKNPQLTGVGNLLMQNLLAYAKNELKLKNLHSHVLKSNAKALALYAHFDFKMLENSDDESVLLGKEI